MKFMHRALHASRGHLWIRPNSIEIHLNLNHPEIYPGYILAGSKPFVVEPKNIRLCETLRCIL